MECPLATIDGQVNLRNHLRTIRVAGLGPADPSSPSNAFWLDKAKRWDVGVQEARSQLCSNCGHYLFTEKVQECMAQHDNITPDQVGPGWVDTNDSGGWCNLYDITCTAHRTCVDWEPGGPVTTENNMEEHNDAAPKSKKAKQAKISRVMKEFKSGSLKSSSGQPIKNYKQAVAIALSEAGMSMPKKDASEDYMRAFIQQILKEEEAMQEEGMDSQGKP